MKILVYGAGVIGSYLAHILLHSQNDVSLLARGERAKEIEAHGLEIRHYLQCKTTCDDINVVTTLHPDDKYDIVFIVMQYAQVHEILPTIAASKNSKLFVFIGNNPSAVYCQQYILGNSPVPKELVFAFQSVGGRRENGKVISIHAKKASALTLGSLDGNAKYKKTLEKAFEQSQFTLEHSPDINAMLVSHIAFILPLAFACYAYNGNLKVAFQTASFRHKVIQAIDEGFRVVEANGIVAIPSSQVDLVRQNVRKASLLLKFIANTPFGRLAISDHAMAATVEMKALANEFKGLRESTTIETPNWIELERYLMTNK